MNTIDKKTRLECLRLAANLCQLGSHYSQILDAAKAFEAYLTGE